MWDDIRDYEPGTLRDALMVKCTFIAYYVITGEKIEGVEAQLQHYARTKGAEAKAGK
jgi:hypothetical protein